MKSIIAGLLILLPLLAHTKPNSEWVYMLSSEGGKWEYWGKPSSYKVDKGFVSLIVQELNAKENKAELTIYKVGEKACRAGQGYIVAFSIAGNYIFHADYVADASTVASTIGTQICNYHLDKTKEK